MTDLLWAICGLGGTAAPGASTVMALGLAGLLGGVGHCSIMCGPFVLAQVGDRFAGGADGRVMTALLLPYQAGRIATYSLLGGLAGGLGAVATRLGDVQWITPAALALAALVFAVQGAGRLGLGWGEAVASRLARWRPRGFGLGVALGFLPCGLIYGALAAAVGAGGAAQGALGLALFGLGTIPALVAVGWLGLAAGKRWLGLARRAAPYLSLTSAAILAALAIRAF